MQLQEWEHFFKPEIRNSGSVLFRKDKVSVRQPSDTEIQAYVQGMGAIKVSLKCTAVESNTAHVSCSCPQAAKAQACKHIWATLLAAMKKCPDFFESKTDLEFSSLPNSRVADNVSAKATSKVVGNQEYKEKQKQQQAEYRKQQYQKQKLYMQKRKQAKEEVAEPAPYPPDVEQALTFFIENGAIIGDNLNELSISNAKKKLARVFHPDLGGSHDKMVQLIGYTNTLMKFVGA